jgi:hypothetical protein
MRLFRYIDRFDLLNITTLLEMKRRCHESMVEPVMLKEVKHLVL